MPRVTHALFLILFAFFGLTALASEGKKKAVYDAHETYTRYHFKDVDMDFTFGGLVLGAATTGGAEIGEAYQVAGAIKDGDAASWQAEWIKMAERVQKRGEESFSKKHFESARDQFLRASNYYRLSMLAMMPEDSRLKTVAQNSRNLTKRAGALMKPAMEYFEVPFEGTVLPGYFRKANNDNKPHKTVLVLGGGETFAEDLVFFLGPQTFERNYNFVTVDLPGQGLLPLQGKFFRKDMHLAVKAVLDHILKRPEVDPAKLAAIGYSGGGGFVPQAAMHDSRIKAIAMNSCVVDAEQLFATMPVVRSTPKERSGWNSFHANTVKLVNWRWNVPMLEPEKLSKANAGFSFDPQRIKVPGLIIVGEGEYKSDEVKRQQKICLEGMSHPLKKMVVTPAQEGASSHCVMENRSVVGQVFYDWLDEVFSH